MWLNPASVSPHFRKHVSFHPPYLPYSALCEGGGVVFFLFFLFKSTNLSCVSNEYLAHSRTVLGGTHSLADGYFACLRLSPPRKTVQLML